MRMGRMEEARKSLAWALMIDPKEMAVSPTGLPQPPQNFARYRTIPPRKA